MKSKTQQIEVLNCLRADFKRWAGSSEPSTWELNINEIGRNLMGFTKDDEPTVLLDCTESEGDWFLCVNTCNENEIGCYPLEELSDDTQYEIRRIVESWLARKDIDSFIDFIGM
jgi:hypothetical protein